eukprot:gene7515-7029_t
MSWWCPNVVTTTSKANVLTQSEPVPLHTVAEGLSSEFEDDYETDVNGIDHPKGQ